MYHQRIPWKFICLCRGYATGQSRRPNNTTDRPYDHGLTRWPQTKRFTPYDVLEQDFKAPYDKRQFYKLAMVYHPDTWRYNTYHGISKAVRVERYGLLITAHRILSNPTQRRAYDLYGVGWEHGTLTNHTTSRCEVPYSSRRYTQASRMHNALYTTWEDVGVWNEPSPFGRGRQQPKGLFMCNRHFGLLLLVFFIMCACVQLTKVKHGTRQLRQRSDRLHNALSQDLLLIERDTGCLSRQQRMERFVRHRDSAIKLRLAHEEICTD